jgi:hypothetical protein
VQICSHLQTWPSPIATTIIPLPLFPFHSGFCAHCLIADAAGTGHASFAPVGANYVEHKEHDGHVSDK